MPATSSARVNFRAGSVRQSLWIKRATPAFTFTIVVNYSKFFPRRFYPDHRRLSTLSLSLSRLSPSPSFPPPGFFFFILPFRLRTRPFLLLPSRRVASTSVRWMHVIVGFIERLVHPVYWIDSTLNYSRHHEFNTHVFWDYNITHSTSSLVSKIEMLSY